MRFIAQKAQILMKMADALANTAFGEWIGAVRLYGCCDYAGNFVDFIDHTLYQQIILKF
jgi:hypothetical protein